MAQADCPLLTILLYWNLFSKSYDIFWLKRDVFFVYIAFGESSSIDEGRCRNQLFFESHILTFKNFDSLTSANLIF